MDRDFRGKPFKIDAMVFGVDSQLIEDGMYLVAEARVLVALQGAQTGVSVLPMVSR
jgi:hypothetical protein